MVSNLFGGFVFTRDMVEAKTQGLKYGIYLLSDGTRSENNLLVVKYVGRTDDLHRRLMEHLSDSISYKFFWYRACENDAEAYLQECKDYHLYGRVAKLVNDAHPRKPDGMTIVCPDCGQ